jgi:hypothetical protein
MQARITLKPSDSRRACLGSSGHLGLCLKGGGSSKTFSQDPSTQHENVSEGVPPFRSSEVPPIFHVE